MRVFSILVVAVVARHQQRPQQRRERPVPRSILLLLSSSFPSFLSAPLPAPPLQRQPLGRVQGQHLVPRCLEKARAGPGSAAGDARRNARRRRRRRRSVVVVFVAVVETFSLLLLDRGEQVPRPQHLDRDPAPGQRRGQPDVDEEARDVARGLDGRDGGGRKGESARRRRRARRLPKAAAVDETRERRRRFSLGFAPRARVQRARGRKKRPLDPGPGSGGEVGLRDDRLCCCC